jgi:hypothetical protein
MIDGSRLDKPKFIKGYEYFYWIFTFKDHLGVGIWRGTH